jgi:hypothetical protein
MGRSLFTVAVPGFLQASAPRLLHVREVLGAEIAELGEAIAPIARRLNDPRGMDEDAGGLGNGQRSSVIGSDDMSDIHSAAGAMSQAWEEKREELLMGASDDEVRVIEGTITIAAVQLPWDVALTSSVRAIGVLSPRVLKEAGERESEATKTVGTMVKRDPMQGRSVLSLLVKPMGQGSKRH